MDECRNFRETIEADHMAPLWEVLRGLTPREPVQIVKPVIWRAETIARNMSLACETISAEDAERRVLVLENPELKGRSLATISLYAGVQMILPGEIAPSHRHTASALRLILSGQGGFTSVGGEKVMMSPGDFIITPTDTFHDHGAEGPDPVMWLDGLDVPVVQMLNAGFSADDARANEDPRPHTGCGQSGSGVMAEATPPPPRRHLADKLLDDPIISQVIAADHIDPDVLRQMIDAGIAALRRSRPASDEVKYRLGALPD